MVSFVSWPTPGAVAGGGLLSAVLAGQHLEQEQEVAYGQLC